MKLSLGYFIRRNMRNLFVAFLVTAVLTSLYAYYKYPVLLERFLHPFKYVYLFSNENCDLAYFLALITITLVAGIKLLLYKLDYRRHPTYRQFDKLLGNPVENEESIDSELEAEVKKGSSNNELVTTNWIITKGLFMTKISVVPRKSRLDE